MAGVKLATLLTVFSLNTYGQIESQPGVSVHCYTNRSRPLTGKKCPEISNGRVGKFSADNGTGLSTFRLDLSECPIESHDAIRYATRIWEQYIQTSIPIHVQVIWSPSNSNILASTQSTKLYRKIPGAEFPTLWYPVALAEKIMGTELNGEGQPDIVITLNANHAWHFGVSETIPFDQYDLATIVIHEIAHGLGFISSATVENEEGHFGDDEDHVLIFDHFLSTAEGVHLLNIQDPLKLFEKMTSNTIMFDLGDESLVNPHIYSPANFETISSLSHFDEISYPTSSENSLMTPRLEEGEVNRAPGELLIWVLSRMGWSMEQTFQFSLYPNPNDGSFKIAYSSQVNILEATILNVLGNTLYSIGISDQIMIGQPPGVYILKIRTDKGSASKRFTIQ